MTAPAVPQGPGPRTARADAHARPRVRRARTLCEYEAVARIYAEIDPSEARTVAEMRWIDRHYPSIVRLLATVDGEVAGTALTGRVIAYPPEAPEYWAVIEVLPRYRRRGLGTRLYRAISARARRAGKTAFIAPVSGASSEGLSFLEHRGFIEVERAARVRLELRGMVRPDPAPPPGVSITTLAARPDLARAVHAVATVCWPDVPSGGIPMQAGPFEEWAERELHGPNARLDAYFVALADDAVVGFADLYFMPARPEVAAHGMTGVAREWRGRGVASALKRATIAWAIDTGLEGLEAANDLPNAPMRAINARLGYRPLPDAVTMRGPLAPPRTGRPSRGA